MNVNAIYAAFFYTPPNAPAFIRHPDDYAFKGGEESPEFFGRLIENGLELNFFEVICGFGDATGDGEPEPIFPAKQHGPLFEVKSLDGRTCQQKIADSSRMNDERTLGTGSHESQAIIDRPGASSGALGRGPYAMIRLENLPESDTGSLGLRFRR